MQALEPLWNQAPETASRVRGRIESVLDWAAARGYRTGENPARWRGHLANLLPNRRRIAPVQHLPALPYAEVAGFMAQLAGDESVAARALAFAILTATRTGEVIGARWDEISMADRLWTIPSERMKAGREHRVPLSLAAIELLKKVAETRYSDWVFSGRQVGQSLGKSALLVAMKRAAGDHPMTVHGFRSCFRDWCAEVTRFPADVAEMALGHQVNSAVEAAYRRGDMFDRRRELAEDWARYCTAPPTTVVPLRASQRVGSRG
jgi:integrase